VDFRGFRFVPDGTNIDFVRRRFAAFAVTGLLLLATVASLAVQGLNLGIDFKGGVLMEVASPGPIDLAALRGRLAGLGAGDADLQLFGTPNQALIRLPAPGPDDASKAVVGTVRDSLAGEFEFRRVEQVGPKVGGELFRDGILATVFAVLGIGIYVYFRFEWQFAVAALLATAHDVVLAVGLFAVLGLEFDLSAVAALLTLAGYSVNDTVVVFDRIRETMRLHKSEDLHEIVNRSLNQTLSRTMLTSGTTLLAVLPLVIFGGDALFNFSLAVTWGIVIGTYSSIFVAASLLLYMPPIRRTVAEEEADTADSAADR